METTTIVMGMILMSFALGVMVSNRLAKLRVNAIYKDWEASLKFLIDENKYLLKKLNKKK